MGKETLELLLSQKSLSTDQAHELMNSIMTGAVVPEMIAAVLIALRAKGEVAAEVAGFASAMHANSIRIDIRDKEAVDGCGTGGDGANSFNISTAAALVAAGAGVTVAKHGNRSVSSKCGSADLLAATGGEIDPGPEAVQRSIDEVGFGFMFAPRFHPAMKYAAPVRRALGVRTVFNILGPLTNPAGVQRQVIGVYDASLLDLVAEVGRILGRKHLIVAHSHDGLDEFSVSAPTDYVELLNGALTKKTLTPAEVDVKPYPADAITGGDAGENLKMLHSIFKGEPSACRDAVLVNAGAMIYVGGQAESIREGFAKAADTIDSGQAAQKLADWSSFTQQGSR